MTLAEKSPSPGAVALVLAGGTGTRFWPLSRRSRPKQFLALDGERSLLQATVDRLQPLVTPERVWICTTSELRREVLEQLPEVPAGQVLAEPEGRNTAAAIGWTLRSLPEAARRGAVVGAARRPPGGRRAGVPARPSSARSPRSRSATWW